MRSVTDAVLSVGTTGARRTGGRTLALFLPSNLASKDAAARHAFCFAFFSP